jgi:hypothetical protein
VPWTNDPVNTPADAVRSLVGDTDAANPLLLDTQYAAWLAETGNDTGRAAHRAALALEAKYATLVDETLGPLRYAYSQQAKAYHDLADNLLASSQDAIGVPIAAAIAGGIVDANGTDIVPFFGRDFPG